MGQLTEYLTAGLDALHAPGVAGDEASFRGYSVNVVINYDPRKQGGDIPDWQNRQQQTIVEMRNDELTKCLTNTANPVVGEVITDSFGWTHQIESMKPSAHRWLLFCRITNV